MDHSALRHQAEDTVGIVIYPVKAGSEIAVKDIVTEEISCLTVREDIPIFHKIALSGMVEGQDVVEYGQVIGRATADIPAGAEPRKTRRTQTGGRHTGRLFWRRAAERKAKPPRTFILCATARQIGTSPGNCRAGRIYQLPGPAVELLILI